MSNIKIVADAIFTKKVNWSDISEEDKKDNMVEKIEIHKYVNKVVKELEMKDELCNIEVITI